MQELESALRAEKDLRRQASEEHQAALAGLRARLAELEVQRSAGAEPGPGRAAAGKSALGLRRIRGIGPAYERALASLGVTRVQQIAAWTPRDVQTIAEKLKIRVERIAKDDWVEQARALERDAEAEGWD